MLLLEYCSICTKINTDKSAMNGVIAFFIVISIAFFVCFLLVLYRIKVIMLVIKNNIKG